MITKKMAGFHKQITTANLDSYTCSSKQKVLLTLIQIFKKFVIHFFPYQNKLNMRLFKHTETKDVFFVGGTFYPTE